MNANITAKSQVAESKSKLKIWKHPISRIVLGGLVILICTILLKVLVLKPGIESLKISEFYGKPIQWSLTLFMGFLSYYFFFKWIEKRPITELSLKHAPKELLVGFGMGALCISICLFFLFMMGYYNVTGISSDLSILRILILIIVLATLEEIIFRGVLYRILESWLGTHWALVISSFLFGIMHVTNENTNVTSIIAVIMGGAMVGIVYTLTKRLWLPIALHIGWNFAQVFYGVRLSGVDDFLEFRFFKSTLSGPAFWTGGEFGVENSVFAISLTAVIFVIVYWRVRQRGQIIERYKSI